MIQTLFGSTPEPLPEQPSASQPTGLLERLKLGIQKTRAGLVDKVEDVLLGKKEIDADLLDELEYTLITADVGVRTSTEIWSTILPNCAA